MAAIVYPVRSGAASDIKDFATGRLLGAGGCSLSQTLLDRVELRVRKAVATHAPGIEHAQRCDRLETLVDFRSRRNVVSAAAADAEETEDARYQRRDTA